VPLHRDNARSGDWIIMLEANTAIGPSRESFRVASALALVFCLIL
jgi:hypothetical protein